LRSLEGAAEELRGKVIIGIVVDTGLATAMFVAPREMLVIVVPAATEMEGQRTWVPWAGRMIV
jgi:hypothetical protein